MRNDQRPRFESGFWERYSLARRQNVYALLLVAIIELLWLRVDTSGWYSPGQWDRSATRISLGFPLPAASWTTLRTTGYMPPWTNYPDREEWKPGVRVFPMFQGLAVLSAVVLFVAIRWLLRFEVAHIISYGFVLGVLFGALTRLSTRPPTRTESDDAANWLNGFWVFIALPAVICFLSRHKRQWWNAALMLLSTLTIVPWASLWFDQFWSWSGRMAIHHGYRILKPSLEDMVFAPMLIYGIVIGLVFVMRRFAPLFRTHESAA